MIAGSLRRRTSRARVIRSWPRSDRLLEVLDDCSDEAVEMTLEVGAWRLRERGADSRSARDDIMCRVRQRLRAEVVAPVTGCGTYQEEGAYGDRWGSGRAG